MDHYFLEDVRFFGCKHSLPKSFMCGREKLELLSHF
uniref:Uncharacterized protein n=1 Tax=Utricularia reniformis TaxID=192314 RepID=A0A1Y0B4C9_9LAMI|nr:hypothetical protein AEK19_MT2090 [Utricularia reniformis]ART32244.1 hypothetical protein AEK19_MT2090 [Utricularia reniformis]